MHEIACMHVVLGNDGESENRNAVSRSTSAAASTFWLKISLVTISMEIWSPWFFFAFIEVATSKSDTMKSATSSSAASSREVYFE